MIDVKKNNYLLPLRGEEHSSEGTFVRDLGVNARIKMERAPVFNELQAFFWEDHFNKQTCPVMISTCQALNLHMPKPIKKEGLVTVLSTYFRQLVTPHL